MSSKVLIHHSTCGRDVEVTITNLVTLDRGCKYCNSNRVDKRKIFEKINTVDPDNYNAISCGEKTSDFAMIKHLACGKEFQMRAADFLYNNHRCPFCNKKPVYTEDAIRQKVLELAPDYELIKIEMLKNEKPSRCKITILHKECGSEHTLRFNNFLINGQRCKACALKNLRISEKSHQVQLIEDYLNKNNVSFTPEKTFPDLKYKRQLRFDFFLETAAGPLCIEFDGKQHFKTNEHNKVFTKEKFEDIQKRDELKNEYCKNKNIELIRFNYLQTDEEITNILNSRLLK